MTEVFLDPSSISTQIGKVALFCPVSMLNSKKIEEKNKTYVKGGYTGMYGSPSTIKAKMYQDLTKL